MIIIEPLIRFCWSLFSADFFILQYISLYVSIQFPHNIATIHDKFHHSQIKSNKKDYFWLSPVVDISYMIYF